MTAGGAFNTLVAARRDGLDAVHVGARGTGGFADVAAAALRDAGIPALGPVYDVDTGYSVVLVDPSGERTFVTHVGAEARLTRQDLDAVALEAGDLVVVSGYSLAHSPRTLPGWVAGLGPEVRVVFDPSPLVASLDDSALAAVLARTDVLTANAREAHLLLARLPSGEGTRTAAGPRPEVDPLPFDGGRAGSDATRLAARARPGAAVVVRDGADGCWVAEHGAPSAERIPGFPSRVLDTTGAGDAHCGVLCAGLARGGSLTAAARRANAAASIAVGRRGPATAPTAVEIEALLALVADPA
nr:PfkB family carbohydrate kinase [Frondihabitans sucicola]